MASKTKNGNLLPKLYAIALFETKNGILNMDPDTGDSGGEPRRLDDDRIYTTPMCTTRALRNMIDLLRDSGQIPEEGNAIHICRGKPVATMTEEAVLKKDPEIFQKIMDAAGELEAENSDEGNGKKKKGKKKKGKQYPADKAQAILCSTFFDDRNLGGVGTSTLIENFGLRGAFSFGMGVSEHPVEVVNYPITRMAPDSKKELEENKRKTMGRSGFVPYALVRQVFTFDPAIAAKNGATAEDVKNMIQAYLLIWDNIYTSSKRGVNGLRELYVCKHQSPFGNMSILDFENRLAVNVKDGVEQPSSYEDFDVDFNEKGLPSGVEIIKLPELRESLDRLVS